MATIARIRNKWGTIKMYREQHNLGRDMRKNWDSIWLQIYTGFYVHSFVVVALVI